MLDIMRLAHRLGVEFAFPTQTLHIARDEPDAPSRPDEAPGRPDEAPMKESATQSMRNGIEAARAMTRGASWLKSRPPVVTYKGSPPDAHGSLEAESD